MKNFIKSTWFSVSPSFLKGASRVVDLFGKLDDYNFKEMDDYKALKRDWENVGKTISNSMSEYDKKEKSPSK